MQASSSLRDGGRPQALRGDASKAKDAVPQLTTLNVTLHTLRDCLRISALCAVVAKLVHPLYHDVITTSWPYSHRMWFVVSTVAVHEFLYYGMNTGFLLMDRFGIFERYKIDRGSAPEPSRELVAKTLRMSAISHWIVQPLTLYALFPLFTFMGMSVVGPAEPSPFWPMVFRFGFSVLLNDTLFFWTHRLLHHPKLYARFHKQHHEYKGTIGFAAEYATPLEQFLSNQLPVVLGPMLCGMPTSEWLVYLFWRLWRTYEVHSGYDFSQSLLGRIGLLHGHGALNHDFHHTHNIGNFGGPANAFWDHVCGTQDAYLRHLCKHNIPAYHTPYLYQHGWVTLRLSSISLCMALRQ